MKQASTLFQVLPALHSPAKALARFPIHRQGVSGFACLAFAWSQQPLNLDPFILQKLYIKPPVNPAFSPVPQY